MPLPKIVKPFAVAALYAAAKAVLIIRRPRYRFILVLGHMRSGSTLLTHILTSHPDFVGFGESNLFYKTAADFEKLVLLNCHYLHRLYLPERNIVDQINHNEMVTDEVLLAADATIILTRSQEPTVKSLLKLFPNWRRNDAVAYYAARMERLMHYRELLRERSISLTYEDLTSKPETLSQLSKYLELDVPLSANYEINRTTGVVGDTSKNILTGTIVTTANDRMTQSQE
jgi:hypothetical protein